MRRTVVHQIAVAGILLAGLAVEEAFPDEIRVLGPLGGPSDGERFVEVAAGSHHALGLDLDGQVHAWGYNGPGELTDDPCGQCDPPADFGPGRFVTGQIGRAHV